MQHWYIHHLYMRYWCMQHWYIQHLYIERKKNTSLGVIMGASRPRGKPRLLS